jgi:hypothetical protein
LEAQLRYVELSAFHPLQPIGELPFDSKQSSGSYEVSGESLKKLVFCAAGTLVTGTEWRPTKDRRSSL